MTDNRTAEKTTITTPKAGEKVVTELWPHGDTKAPQPKPARRCGENQDEEWENVAFPSRNT